jgi:hypothetical protein
MPITWRRSIGRRRPKLPHCPRRYTALPTPIPLLHCQRRYSVHDSLASAASAAGPHASSQGVGLHPLRAFPLLSPLPLLPPMPLPPPIEHRLVGMGRCWRGGRCSTCARGARAPHAPPTPHTPLPLPLPPVPHPRTPSLARARIPRPHPPVPVRRSLRLQPAARTPYLFQRGGDGAASSQRLSTRRRHAAAASRGRGVTRWRVTRSPCACVGGCAHVRVCV